jgi:FkbM family methyltransferase
VSRIWRRAVNAYHSTAELPDKRRSLPRWAAFELLLRPFTPHVSVEHDGMRYILRTEDRGVSRVTFITGDYDLDVMTEAVARLERILGRDVIRGRTFVDVGANVGTTSIPAVHRFGARRGIAFEPSEENFRILSANVALNGLGDRIEAHQVGVSDAEGSAELELAPRNSGDHRVRTATAGGFDAYHEGRRPTVEVRLVRLDDALAEHGVDLGDIGLVWVDTQGHEGHVLAGAAKLLAARVPVFCEYWPYGLRRAGGFDRFNAIVAASFSEVVDVRDGSSLPAARVAELADRYQDERYSDLLLVP